MNEWLANLKAGDEVIVRSGVLHGFSLRTVERVTATQIILPNDSRYAALMAVRLGKRITRGALYALPSQRQNCGEQMRKTELVDKLRRVAWEKIGVDVLQDIFDKAKNGQHL